MTAGKDAANRTCTIEILVNLQHRDANKRLVTRTVSKKDRGPEKIRAQDLPSRYGRLGRVARTLAEAGHGGIMGLPIASITNQQALYGHAFPLSF